MSFAGAAGIENGVTIDLVRLRDVEYSEDDGSITVGTGALWGDVYEVLDKLNLMVTGARSSSVGKTKSRLCSSHGPALTFDLQVSADPLSEAATLSLQRDTGSYATTSSNSRSCSATAPLQQPARTNNQIFFKR